MRDTAQIGGLERERHNENRLQKRRI